MSTDENIEQIQNKEEVQTILINIDYPAVKLEQESPFIEYSTIQSNIVVRDLQYNQVPIAPSYLQIGLKYVDFNTPWSSLKREILYRQSNLANDKGNQYQKTDNLSAPKNKDDTYTLIRKINMINARYKLVEIKRAEYENREPQIPKIVSLSVNKNFWYKVLDKKLIQLDNKIPKKQAQKLLYQQLQDWFPILNKLYIERKEDIAIIQKYSQSGRYKSNEFRDYNAKIKLYLFSLIGVPYSKPQKLKESESIKNQSQWLSVIKSSQKIRHQSKNTKNYQMNFMDNQLKLDSRKNIFERSNNFKKTSKMISISIRDCSINSQSMNDKSQLSNQVSLKRITNLFISDKIHKKENVSLTKNMQEKQQKIERFSSSAYRIYNEDKFEQDKTIRLIDRCKTSSDERLLLKRTEEKKIQLQNIQRNLVNKKDLIENKLKKKNKKQKINKLNKSESVRIKEQNQLAVVNSYFPEIEFINQFQKKQFF